MSAQSPSPSPLASWRLNGMGVLRIAFGVVWAIDAWLRRPGNLGRDAPEWS